MNYDEMYIEWSKLSEEEQDDIMNNPKNFVFNYIPETSIEVGEFPATWELGLRFLLNGVLIDLGSYNVYGVEWIEKIGLVELMEGIFEKYDYDVEDREITDKLLKLGVEFEPNLGGNENEVLKTT